MCSYNNNFHTEHLLCVRHSATLCVCKFNPHKNPMKDVILLLILLFLVYYTIIIKRLRDDIKKILKRKSLVGIRNYKQSHFPSKISSWLWPLVWSYSNNKTATSSLLRGQTVRKRFPLEDQSYFNNLYFRFSVIPCLTDGPRIVTEGSHSCHRLMWTRSGFSCLCSCFCQLVSFAAHDSCLCGCWGVRQGTPLDKPLCC